MCPELYIFLVSRKKIIINKKRAYFCIVHLQAPQRTSSFDLRPQVLVPRAFKSRNMHFLEEYGMDMAAK